MRKIEKVFLSSTSKDLKDHRDSVYKAVCSIGTLKCVRMEDFGAQDAQQWSAAEFCQQKVEECDMLVGILGLNYGSIAEGSEHSYTELEYRTAVHHELSRLLFLAPDTFAVQGNLIENDDLRARQKAFREAAVSAEGKKRAIYDTFNSPDDLARRVLSGITNVLVDATTQSFDALGQSLRNPEVLKAALVWRTGFEFCRTQLDLMSHYKDMHDQLHRLQFEFYDVIGSAVRRFPEETADLEVYQSTLQAIAEKLAGIVTSSKVLGSEGAWISEIGRLPSLIEVAISSGTEEPLRQLMRALSRVLTLQPSRINNALTQAAKALVLGDLVKAMHDLTQRCRDSGLGEERVRQLDAGTDALAQLSECLDACTSQHDQWQRMEDEVRRIENAIGSDTKELTESWAILQGLEAGLNSASAALGPIGARLDAALKTAPPMDELIRREFRAYRRCVGTSFDKVDRDLKRLCDDMRRIGESLAPVLEKMS